MTMMMMMIMMMTTQFRGSLDQRKNNDNAWIFRREFPLYQQPLCACLRLNTDST